MTLDMHIRGHYCERIGRLSVDAKSTNHHREFLHALVTVLQHELKAKKFKADIPEKCLDGMEQLAEAMLPVIRDGKNIGPEQIHTVLNAIVIGKKNIEQCLCQIAAEDIAAG